MVGVYLLFGLCVARLAPAGGQLAAFARLLCSPVTRPVARALPPGASERRVLAVALAVAGALWALLVAVDTALRHG